MRKPRPLHIKALTVRFVAHLQLILHKLLPAIPLDTLGRLAMGRPAMP